jgi:sulfoxide reductase catalytic subunit YedY
MTKPLLHDFDAMGHGLRVTPESVYKSRRLFLKQLSLVPMLSMSFLNSPSSANTEHYLAEEESETSFDHVNSYNNYYEFSDNKKAVKHIAAGFKTDNWTLSLEGFDNKSTVLDLADITAFATQNRTYRLRCVEGWSAVIPWQGFELNTLIKMIAPNEESGFVEFLGHYEPSVMIGQRRASLPWPYREGLRLDEALHPLTFIATGMYGKPLPTQNGAPIRLVVPWKYGYKSIKAIRKIRLTKTQPISSWQEKIPSEYGFYANVNPHVPHPRWSQRREVRLGETKKRKTDMLNGYAKYLKGLYTDEELSTLG